MRRDGGNYGFEGANDGWDQKVVQLAEQGVTLNAVVHFYKVDLPRQMPHFNPAKHRTADVVRGAIIPLSKDARSSYASVLMGGRPTLPAKMMTHGWANLFRDFLAAIVADALNEDQYEEIANLLDRDIGQIEEF